MVELIKIKNFRSHRSTLLKFHPQVNSIIGSSDTGKSVILKALLWVIENRPLGNAFISHWALDEKKKQKENTSVLVIANGKKVKRLRTIDKNSYQIDNQKPLEAIGTDVPLEIMDIFNFTEVNVQRQFDSHFLLSESAGEVARFFNKIIRLDIIDSFLSIVDGKKRKTKALRIASESEIDRIGKELKTLDWIDVADRLILKAGRVEDKIEKTGLLRDNLIESIAQYRDYHNELQSIPDIDKAGKLLEDWAITDMNKDKKEAVLYQLQKSIERWTGAFKKSEEELPNLEKAQDFINKYELLQTKAEVLEDDTDELNDKIRRWEILQKQTTFASAEIERLEKQLPERCPTCGQLLREDIHGRI